jgi:lipopolysaccharide transport system permease protein
MFILSSVKSEFKSKFIRSKLGGVWVIINPLSTVAVYAIILSAVLSAKLPGISNRYSYAIYLTAGTIGWSFFSEVVSRCVDIFIVNSNIMKKLAFPKITLPMIVAGSALLNSSLLLITGVFVFVLLGHYVGMQMVWIPLLYLITLIFAFGIGLSLGIINVFVRDVGQVMSIVMQFWFWFTPIVYMENIIPENLQSFLKLNPLYYLIDGFQKVLLYNQRPDLAPLLTVAAVGLFFMGLSFFLYRKAAPEMVDVL